MESHYKELKIFCKMKLFWKNLKSKSIYKAYQKEIRERWVQNRMWTLDFIDSWWKERVVHEVPQVLKFPPIVLRVLFVEAGMEFNVKKAYCKTSSKILFYRDESINTEAEKLQEQRKILKWG